MSSIQGYPSQEKLVNPLDGYNELQSKTSSQFVTLSETFDKKVTLDTKIHGEFRTSALPKVIASIATDYPLRVLKSTAHGAVKGDSIRFEGTAANPYFSAKVILVPDADTIVIGSTLPVAPLVSDEFFVQKSVTPLYDENGNAISTSGPVKFIKDGSVVEVLEDTVTPSNNLPLPVKLTSVTGDINITAGDLNVQLSDTGANPDITRIGDGTNRLVMTAAGEATTFDATTHTALGGVNTELDAQTALLTTIDADTGAILTETQSINTELDSQTAILTTIDADTGAIATSSASINGKLPATIGQKVAAGSLAVVLASDQTLPLPTGAATEATLAALAAEDFATQATLSALDTKTADLQTKIGALTETAPVSDTASSGLNGRLQRIAQRLTSLIGLFPASLGQKTMANSFAVTLASDQSALNVRSGLVPREYDQIDLTYVPSGNGVGEVQTAVYKLATVTQATLTLSYDSSNRLSSVVRT